MSEQLPLLFSGPEVKTKRDEARLKHKLDLIFKLLSDGKAYSVQEIALGLGLQESSVSAQCRNLRKPELGGYNVEGKRHEDGIFRYRLIK
jgi:Mn-dependent DtxR family transcriptional regulator